MINHVKTILTMITIAIGIVSVIYFPWILPVCGVVMLLTLMYVLILNGFENAQKYKIAQEKCVSTQD